MSNVIKPTIGRVVLVHRGICGISDQPEPALVSYVWHDRMINVGGFDHNGKPFALTSLQLLQEDDVATGICYAEWMPYQKGQAAKTEALEIKLEELRPGNVVCVPHEQTDPIEQEIQAKGLTAPRITPADIEANIAAEYYFTAEQAVSGFNSAMVDRFLGWKLPNDFAPDAGISLNRTYVDNFGMPTGTNLLHAGQAKEMLQHVVGGAPVLPALGLLTFCVIVLKNGYTVHGVSACVSPENFDAEIGRKVARENAVQEIWPLMGYALKEKLSNGEAA